MRKTYEKNLFCNPKFLKCDIIWPSLAQSASRLESRKEIQMRVTAAQSDNVAFTKYRNGS